jgi:pimeloyl-ACP methyl ester carboxylesterase
MADTVAGIPSKALQEARQALRERQAGEEVSLARDAYSRRFPERDPARAFLYEQIRGLNPPRVTSPEGATPPAEAEVDLSTFSVPTLFIFGSEDRLAPPELGRLAHKLIPNSRYVEVEEAGHSVYFERPEEFNRIVAEFLRQHQ